MGRVSGTGLVSLYVFLFTLSAALGHFQRDGADPAEDALRSPLDALQASRIPAEDRFAWQPPELVAVLGEHRGRHWDQVYGVAFSPDGKQIASCGEDRVIRLWDADTLRERAELRQHTRSIRAIAFSPDGKTLASGAYDKTVVVWDMTKSPPGRRASFTHEGAIHVAFSADGETLAAGGLLGTVQLWKVAGGKPQAEDVVFRGPPKRIDCLAFSPDGQTLAADAEGTVVLWDVSTRTQKAVLNTKTRYLQSLCFSPDSKWLACCGDLKLGSSCIQLWDVSDRAQPRESAVLPKHAGQVLAVKFSPDGTSLASAGGDVRLWKLGGKAPEEQAVIRAGSWIRSVDFAPDGKTLVTADNNGIVRLWDLKDSGPHERLAPKGHQAAVSGLALSPAGLLASAGRDRTVLWQLSGPEPKERHSLAARDLMAFSRDGKTLALANSDTLEVWDVSGEEPKKRAQVPAKHKLPNVWGVSSLQISPDGKLLLSSGYDNKIRFRDLTDRELTEQKQLALDTSDCALAFGKAGTLTVANYGHGLAGVDPARYQPFRTVRVWDLTNPRAEKTVLEHRQDVVSVSFAPDGQTLATGGGHRVLDQDPPPAGEVRLWRASDQGWRGLVLEGVSASIDTVTFSPDGQILAAAGVRGQVILWETSTGKKCREWQLPGEIRHIVFAADGRHLLTANGNGTIYVFRLSQGARAPGDAAALWQMLASGDADKAYAAIWTLAADARRALPLLQARLKPAEALNPKQVQQSVDRLNDPSFKERDKATVALENLHDAGPILRRYLAQSQLSLEARRRLERILEKLDRIPLVQLQALRAIQILEQIGNLGAQQILEGLSQGAPEARQTQRARQALQRLAERAASLP